MDIGYACRFLFWCVYMRYNFAILGYEVKVIVWSMWVVLWEGVDGASARIDLVLEELTELKGDLTDIIWVFGK